MASEHYINLLAAKIWSDSEIFGSVVTSGNVFLLFFSPYLIPEKVFIVLWSSDNLPARVAADYRRTKICLKLITLLKMGAFPFLTRRLTLKIPVQYSSSVA